MKHTDFAVTFLVVASAAQAQFTLHYNFAPGSVVPDGGQVTQVQTLGELSGLSTFDNVVVRLGLTTSAPANPMYLGDLYSSLTFGTSSEAQRIAVLLNRAGRDNTDSFGSSLSSLNVTLDDSTAGTNVFAAGSGNGTYNADGRLNVNPSASAVAFSAGSNGLAALNGSPLASNRVSLLVADTSQGGVATLSTWGVSITGTAASTGSFAPGNNASISDANSSSSNTLGASLDTTGSTPSGLVVNLAGTTTFSGAITGSGGINKTGTGTAVVNASNTYSGNTTVSAGTLLVTNTTGSGTGSGNVNVNAGILGGSGSIAGNVNLNGATIGSSSATLTLSSNLTTTGTSKVAASSTVNVTGITTISSGVFSVNGNLGGDGAKIIGNTATLKGNGTISGPTTIQAGGTLAPGNSPGVQTFTGDLTLAGTTELEINGSDRGNTYDGINLTGTSANTLTYGGTLSMSFNAPIAVGVYDLFAFGNVTQASAFDTVTIGGTAIDSSAGAITGIGWTASITEIASGPTWNLIFNYATGDLTITAIPEPSAYCALAGFGMIGVVLYRRRSQNAAKRAA